MDYSIEQVQRMLPQKHPFVFIDEVKSVKDGSFGVGIKRLSDLDAIFKSHFPGNPVLPACIQIEMMAQTAIIIILSKYPVSEHDRINAWLLSVDKARFNKEIKPNSVLEIKVNRLKTINDVHCFSGQIFVENVLCAEARFMALQRYKDS